MQFFSVFTRDVDSKKIIFLIKICQCLDTPPWTGRFYALLDPTYAKTSIPIIASVSEHQPTTWASFFFDLHILVFLVPAGLYLCFMEPSSSPRADASTFVMLYGITSVYFSVWISSNSLCSLCVSSLLLLS